MKPLSVFALTVFLFGVISALAMDTDGDGFDDAVEVAEGSDPNDPDVTPLDSALADSVTDFSGVQGQGGWFYGYRNFTADGGTTHYDSNAAFIPFERDGTDLFDAETNHWNGTSWDLQDQAAGPWTQLEADRGRPNGVNSAPNEEHWAVRRWVAQVPGSTPVAIGWNLASANPAGGGTAGSLHINGQRVDFAVIAGDDEEGIYRTYYTHLRPGDLVDLALTPEDVNGERGDGSDASIFGLRINSRFPVSPVQPNGSAFYPHSDAFVIAHSGNGFSGDQGEGGWYHGYRNYTADGGATDYDSDEDFIPFLNDGTGILNPASNHWNGGYYVLQEGGSPWTMMARDSGHPNGVNSAPGEEHWVIRRWMAQEIATVTPLAIRWNVRAENLASGGVGGSLHVDGRRIDGAVVAGNDGEVVTRTAYANVHPGSVIDLGLTPENLDGTRGDGSDRSLFWMEISTLIPAEPRQPDGSVFVPEGGDEPTDSDGDGVSDEDEAIAGTDPMDANSYLRITRVDRAINGITVIWPSVSGKTYTLLYSTSMESDDWVEVGTQEGNGEMISLEDTDPDRLAALEGYYRIRVE